MRKIYAWEKVLAKGIIRTHTVYYTINFHGAGGGHNADTCKHM